MQVEPQLDRLERWMQAVVMHPKGAAAGAKASGAGGLIPEAARNIESVVTRSKQLSALHRLGIYADMYFIRLVEVLTAEYPTTKAVLGEAAFAAACRAFVTKHPSTERTLQSLSSVFPDFLKRHLKGRRQARLAVDVARIERAMEEVFDAPRAEPVSYEAFRAIAPERWGEVALQLTPALRLLALECNADGYMTAVRSRRKARSPRASPAFVIVYRHRWRAWRMRVTREQYDLLRLLARGMPLAEAVYRSCRRMKQPADAIRDLLARWFRDFTALGLFVGIRPPAKT